jgi:hypothetical protein
MTEKQQQQRVSLKTAKDPSAGPEVLAALAKHESTQVRGATAANPGTPAESLALLAGDPKLDVRLSVAENAKTSPAALAMLARDTVEVCLVVALNANTPLVTLTSLASRADSQIRESVAGNPTASLELLTTLASDPDPIVRQSVGANPVTPSDLLALMAKDGVTSLSELAKNVNMPPTLLADLAGNGDSAVRCSVARNPSTPVPTLTKLAFDESRRVVEALAKNPLTPSLLLNILAQALALETTVDTYQLACTLGAPSKVTKWLASSKDDKTGLRRSIASWTTNPITLEEMAKDEELEVRIAVAGNIYTPATALAWMADHDENAKLLKVVAKNPNVSPQTLVACQGEYAHQAYAAFARQECSAQETLTVKVGDTPSVQTGPGGVWLTVKLWVADSNALTMQPNVVADNGLQAAAAATLPVPEVAASLAN